MPPRQVRLEESQLEVNTAAASSAGEAAPGTNGFALGGALYASESTLVFVGGGDGFILGNVAQA